MNVGRTIFSQLMDFLPRDAFQHCVQRYNGDHNIQTFSCFDQYLAMAFAQLTGRESLRDIEACLQTFGSKLYHAGFRCTRIPRNTLANANQVRPWQMYADFAQILIAEATKLYADTDLGFGLDNTIYALDSTTIDLCLSLFPWATFRQTKAAVKMHTLLNLKGSIPEFIHITEGSVHDVNILDELPILPAAIYLLDRGYLDFARLFLIQQAGAFFVTRTKSNTRCNRIYSHPVDKTTGLVCDQSVRLTNRQVAMYYPGMLRRVRYNDPETGKHLVFLTNLFHVPALTIAMLYRGRCMVELFFKWIKQHLRIKQFFGTTPNAVKTQIRIAVSVYVLVAIVKKHLAPERNLYTLLQILSLSLFEKMPILQAFSQAKNKTEIDQNPIQLKLFKL
ncbi:MAG: IS4 family transposase [Planctomycetaceae bacterium]|nr:MAG: IS4 family transposase [Planctomycetaceae bacterium]